MSKNRADYSVCEWRLCIRSVIQLWAVNSCGFMLLLSKYCCLTTKTGTRNTACPFKMAAPFQAVNSVMLTSYSPLITHEFLIFRCCAAFFSGLFILFVCCVHSCRLMLGKTNVTNFFYYFYLLLDCT